MDGAQFAKMLSDKHLFELNRMEYKYSTVSVKEFAELLRQNFAQPLPLTDFSGNKLFYLPNLAQISTNGMKQLLCPCQWTKLRFVGDDRGNLCDFSN